MNHFLENQLEIIKKLLLDEVKKFIIKNNFDPNFSAEIIFFKNVLEKVEKKELIKLIPIAKDSFTSSAQIIRILKRHLKISFSLFALILNGVYFYE